MDQGIVQYIRDAIRSGYPEGEIRKLLKASGWQDADLDRAFMAARGATAPPPMPPIRTDGTRGMRSVVDLFSDSLSEYRGRLWTLVGVYVGYMVLTIPAVILVVGGAIAVAVMGGLSFKHGNPMDLAAAGFVPLVLILILGPYVLVIVSWWTASLVYAVKDGAERIGVIESYRRGWSKFRPTLGAMVLQAICIVASLVPAGVLAVIAAMMRSAAALVLVPAAVVAAFVPVILVSVWFSLACYVVVAENASAMSALRRSMNLVEGHWWSVFLRYLLLGIVFVFITLLPMGIFLGMSRMAPLGISLALTMIGQLVQFVIGIVTTPYAFVYCYGIYRDLRSIKG